MINILFLSFYLFSFQESGDVLVDVEKAIKIGSAKELVKYCGETIALKIEGKSADYSRNQSETVLRNFFQKNPVRGFSYIHKGSSPDGIKYAIGSYSVDDGSYRVVMRLKKINKSYQIYNLNFSKE